MNGIIQYVGFVLSFFHLACFQGSSMLRMCHISTSFFFIAKKIIHSMAVPHFVNPFIN